MAAARKKFSNRSIFKGDPLEFHVERAKLTTDEFPYHEHEFSELVVITGGQSIHVTEDGEYPIAAGDAFVFNGHHAHGFREARALRLYNVMYNPEKYLTPRAGLRTLSGFHALFVLEPQYRKAHRFRSRLHLDMDDLARASEMLAELEREYAARSPGFEAALRGTFLRLVVFLSRRYSASPTAASRQLLRIGEVMSVMEARSHERLALGDLAARAHMSVNQFLRVFRAATGHSPIEYLIRLRVMKASELLRASSEKITSLALRVGFSDGNYFAKQFRAIMGTSPREFRMRASDLG